MDFNTLSFWIQVHNVHLVMHTENCAQRWGEVISLVEGVDLETPVMHVRIKLDITKPLRRMLPIYVRKVAGILFQLWNNWP